MGVQRHAPWHNTFSYAPWVQGGKGSGRAKGNGKGQGSDQMLDVLPLPNMSGWWGNRRGRPMI
eukprot:2756457-Pyramimonas_sp.AAC.1